MTSSYSCRILEVMPSWRGALCGGATCRTVGETLEMDQTPLRAVQDILPPTTPILPTPSWISRNRSQKETRNAHSRRRELSQREGRAHEKRSSEGPNGTGEKTCQRARQRLPHFRRCRAGKLRDTEKPPRAHKHGEVKRDGSTHVRRGAGERTSKKQTPTEESTPPLPRTTTSMSRARGCRCRVGSFEDARRKPWFFSWKWPPLPSPLPSVPQPSPSPKLLPPCPSLPQPPFAVAIAIPPVEVLRIRSERREARLAVGQNARRRRERSLRAPSSPMYKRPHMSATLPTASPGPNNRGTFRATRAIHGETECTPCQSGGAFASSSSPASA